MAGRPLSQIRFALSNPRSLRRLSPDAIARLCQTVSARRNPVGGKLSAHDYIARRHVSFLSKKAQRHFGEAWEDGLQDLYEHLIALRVLKKAPGGTLQELYLEQSLEDWDKYASEWLKKSGDEAYSLRRRNIERLDSPPAGGDGDEDIAPSEWQASAEAAHAFAEAGEDITLHPSHRTSSAQVREFLLREILDGISAMEPEKQFLLATYYSGSLRDILNRDLLQIQAHEAQVASKLRRRISLQEEDSLREEIQDIARDKAIAEKQRRFLDSIDAQRPKGLPKGDLKSEAQLEGVRKGAAGRFEEARLELEKAGWSRKAAAQEVVYKSRANPTWKRPRRY